MKHLLIILLLCFVVKKTCFSQAGSSDIIHIKELSKEGILLNQGWKFQAGDNMEWAKPEFNDEAWQPINPAEDIFDLPQLKKQGIGWFRLHLQLDSALLKESLVLIIFQTGASEIYLNGRRIYIFGKVSPNQKEIKTFNPLNQPVSIKFSNDSSQVLAVRFALKMDVPYSKYLGFPNRCFVASINTTNQQIKIAEGRYPFIFNFFRIGVFSILSILHFALFLLNRKNRANLFLSFFAILAIISNIFYVKGSYFDNGEFTTPDVELKMYLLSASTIFFNLYHLLFLKALCIIVNYRNNRIYQLFTVCFLVSIPLIFWPYQVGWIFPFIILPNAILIECVRISFLALKRKQKGAVLLAVGAIGFIIFYAAFYAGIYFSLGTLSPYYSDLTYSLGELSLPIATSLILAFEFAFINHSLEEKLQEVQSLSKQAVSQEQEKQQILASQNERLEKQVAQRTVELQHSLHELKATQSQLVQKEKLASLGELTAGIAHEIQNPLNFVNNFSEVSEELCEELAEELQDGNTEAAAVIASDVKQNLQKIKQHGQRADAIVKGMLQHSRASSGTKEPTDINALAEEYLRLSYHGLRAKNKNFNAALVTDFDKSIGKVEVVPQEIGRVLLNLFNNAFYATQQKKSQLNGQYQPEVQVITKLQDGKVEIKIRDNGSGIPDKVIDKIFQPFFTTKPTGQGTGLGLSLSYDIITKGHGGELKVNSIEGEFTEFIVSLPVNPTTHKMETLPA